MVEFNSQRPLPGREVFGLKPAEHGRNSNTERGVGEVDITYRPGTSLDGRLKGIVRAIACHCELHLFGIDVAVTRQGECLVVDFNHLPNGVAASTGFAAALADLISERASLTRGKRQRR